MINHGSGMLLCLKSVSNRLLSPALSAVKRRHVIQEKGLPRHLFKTTFIREYYNTSLTPSLPPVVEASYDHLCAADLKGSAVKTACVQCTNTPSSKAVQLYKSKIDFSSKNSSLASHLSCINVDSQLTQFLGVPCSGTQDDIVLVNIPDLHFSKPKLVSSSEEAPLLYSDLEKQMILLSQSDNDGSSGLVVKKEYISGDPNDPPTAEQIEKVRSTLAKDLPMFFVKPLTYSIYHPSIVFENNIKGKKTKGFYEYVKQAAFLRTVGHLRFIYVKFEVMKITGHPEDGTVKVRWKINIIKFKRLFKFWQMRLWDWSTIWDKVEVWHDGFSTYYLRGDGLVYKHVADKMIPDTDPILEKKVLKKAGTAAETLHCAKTPHSFHILYNPSKNVSEPLELNGL